MATPSITILTDTSGQNWQILATNNGLLQTQATTTSGVVSVYVIDSLSSTIWQVAVETTGELNIQAVTPPSSFPLTTVFAPSPSGLIFLLQISNGTLESSLYQASSACAPPLYLMDSSGQIWQVTTSNIGKFITTPISNVNSIPTLYIRDGAMSITWGLIVLASGDPRGDQGQLFWSPSSPPPPMQAVDQFVIQSPNLTFWGGQIENGRLYSYSLDNQELGEITNRWTIGLQYSPTWNNINWSQPGGVGTLVYPQPQNGPFLNSPVPGEIFSELSGFMPPCGCGHQIDLPLIIQEWDYCTNKSVALVCCPVCSYVQYTIEPYHEYRNPVTHPIVFT